MIQASAKNGLKGRFRRRMLAAIAVAAVVGFATSTASSASAQTGPIQGFSHGANNYWYFNQANVNHTGASAVTYASLANNAPTPNQWAVAQARLADEWGTICWGPQVFSSYPNGAASTSCKINHTSFASQGNVWGWGGASWRQWPTYYLWYDQNAGARTSSAAPVETPDWPVNEAGQTFGNEALAAEPSEAPDLTTATATNGERGYLLQTDVDSATANHLLDENASPETIRTWLDTVGSVDRYIPVYASDGKTVVGEFLVPGAKSASEVGIRE